MPALSCSIIRTIIHPPPDLLCQEYCHQTLHISIPDPGPLPSLSSKSFYQIRRSYTAKNMFRRIITTSVPARITAPSAARTVLVGASKRSYHEKDMFSPSSLRLQLVLTYIPLLDHYSNPRNVGSMPKGDMDVGTGLVGAPACTFLSFPLLLKTSLTIFQAVT